MTRVALLTSAYPFLPGEQFLEEEIVHWARVPGLTLVVMPMSAQGRPRPMPAGVDLDLSLARRWRAAERAWYLLLALFSPVLWREWWYVLRERRGSWYCMAKAWHASAVMLRSYRALRRPLQAGRYDLLYCYWNDSTALGAALHRRRGTLPRLVTRIHNYELYEEEMPHAYIPLKRQFVRDFDRFFAVARHGQAYLPTVYGVPRERAMLSRLGVRMPASATPASEGQSLHLLSISYCVSYKQVHVIIEAVARLARRLPGYSIRWTHIGDGPLFEELKSLARQKLNLRGLQWDMVGHLSNAEVRRFLSSTPIDLLLNASKNEGVPVSVMEAMSCGIPAVAPNVGGLSELVSRDCGWLMSPAAGASELVHAIMGTLGQDQRRLRAAARAKILREYEAARNYSRFVQQCLELAAPIPASPVKVFQQAHV